MTKYADFKTCFAKYNTCFHLFKNKNTVVLSCHSFENVIHDIPVTSNGLTYDAKAWRYVIRSKRKLTRYNVRRVLGHPMVFCHLFMQTYRLVTDTM